MEWLRKSKKLLLGGLTGSYITLFVPPMPIGLGGEYFTLEELSWQASSKVEPDDTAEWSFQWVNSRGFVLQRESSGRKPYTTSLKRAVYRRIIEE